jgi:hypothetical protein
MGFRRKEDRKDEWGNALRTSSKKLLTMVNKNGHNAELLWTINAD